MIGLFTKRKTRYKWPVYTSLEDVPTEFQSFLADDVAADFRAALHQRDYARATTLYQRSDTESATTILAGLRQNDRDLQQRISDFFVADKQNPVACVCYADSMLERAWAARSRKFYRDLSQEQIAAFHSIMDNTHRVIETMLEHAAHDPLAWTTAITYDMAANDDKNETRKLWENGCKADPMCWRLHTAYVYNLDPRWDGTSDLMEAAVQSIAQIRPRSYLEGIRPSAFLQKLGYADACGGAKSAERVRRDPNERHLVVSAYNRMRKDKSCTLGLFSLALFANAFYDLGEDRLLLDALEQTDFRFMDAGWSSRQEITEGPRSLVLHRNFLKSEVDNGRL